jgi:hypothetical protein
MDRPTGEDTIGATALLDDACISKYERFTFGTRASEHEPTAQSVTM